MKTTLQKSVVLFCSLPEVFLRKTYREKVLEKKKIRQRTVSQRGRKRLMK